MALVVDDFVRIDYYKEDITKLLETIRPLWPLEDVHLDFKEFTGGLTNKLIGCRCREDTEWRDMILFRIYGENTGGVIDRNHEIIVMQVFEKSGCGQPVYCRFANGMAYKFTPGTVLDPSSVRDERVAKNIARHLADVHSVDFTKIMNDLGIGDKIPSILTESKVSDYPKSYHKQITGSIKEKYGNEFMSKEELNSEILVLQLLLDTYYSQTPKAVIHNDLVPQNIIWDDKYDAIRLIDWENSCFRITPFDIGSHFAGYCFANHFDESKYPTIEEQIRFIRWYLERLAEIKGEYMKTISDELIQLYRKQVNICALMYGLVVTCWCIVQNQDGITGWDHIDCALSTIIFCRKLKASDKLQ